MKPSKKIPLIIMGGLFFSITLVFVYLLIVNTLFPKNAFSLDLIGKVPLCNRNIERAIIINGFVFPFCIRCTSMILSYLIAIILLFIPKVDEKFSKFNISIVIILAIVCIVPLVIDGIKVYFFQIDSKNYIRVITGILFGIGVSLLTKVLITKLFNRKITQ